MVVHFRELNKITLKPSFPIPRMDDALESLFGMSWFTKLDARQGFRHMELHPDSCQKCAFTTRSGKYQYKVSPYGNTQAPIDFAMLMDSILAEHRFKICVLYIDDIIVYSKAFPDHLNSLKIIFNTLEKSNIKLRPDKCHFGFEEILFVGHLVSQEGIKVNPKKIESVQSLAFPKTVKEIQHFLGLCGFYRRFIENFSHIAKPLTELTKSTVPWTWGKEQENAFTTLRDRMITAPILVNPSPEGELTIKTDASGYATAGILLQSTNGEFPRPIAYTSKTLSDAEQRYSASERECLAIIHSLDHFHPYIFLRKFKIITDHQALCHLLTLKNRNGQLSRWALSLQAYDFEVHHISGKKLLDADALSRLFSDLVQKRDGGVTPVTPQLEAKIRRVDIFLPEEIAQGDDHADFVQHSCHDEIT